MENRITKISNEGLQLLKELEGFRSKPYLDAAGVPTIGYGSTYYKNGTRVTMQDVDISQFEATTLLEDLLIHFERTVDCYTRDDIKQHEFDGLVCFAYNVGGTAFKKSTLIKKVNANTSASIITAEFLKWINVNGKPNAGLKNRRLKEINLYFQQ
jgi:lysozyme